METGRGGRRTHLELGLEHGCQQHGLLRNFARDVAQGGHELLNAGTLRHQARLEQVDNLIGNPQRNLGERWWMSSEGVAKGEGMAP